MPLFAIGCRWWPCRRFRWASNLAFQRQSTKLKRHWMIAHSCRSPTVSARLRYRVLSLYMYIVQGRLRKNICYPTLKLRNCSCHLKRKNTSTWSVLLAWSMPTKCFWVIHGRLTSKRTTSTSPSTFSIPPLKRQAPWSLHAFMNQSSIIRFLAPTSALAQLRADLHAIQQINREVLQTEYRFGFWKGPCQISAGPGWSTPKKVKPNFLFRKPDFLFWFG